MIIEKTIDKHFYQKEKKIPILLKKYSNEKFRYNLKIVFIIIIIWSLFFSLNKKKKKPEIIKFNYFACFCAILREENLYIRDLIAYYLDIGFDKFIIGDNNYPNVEKLSDVTQDYIKSGILDIIEVFGTYFPLNEFFGIIYEKYKSKCAWISFFDGDEYLRMHSGDNKLISIKQYLSNPVFKKCESISINWLIYSDNNLLYYDNRSIYERFTSPLYKHRENRLVKSIVRGNLNKLVFTKDSSNHIPNKKLHICNSRGKIIKRYSIYVYPPLVKYTYLMHYTTKTAEEFIKKIKRGRRINVPYNITERIKKFFFINNYTEEKLKMFEKAFNTTFPQFHNFNDYIKIISINKMLVSFSFFFLYF